MLFHGVRCLQSCGWRDVHAHQLSHGGRILEGVGAYQSSGARGELLRAVEQKAAQQEYLAVIL